MSDRTPSPRKQLLQAMGKTLQLISTDNGYLTDAGAGWTLEPKPGDQDTQTVLTAVIEKQQRAESPRKSTRTGLPPSASSPRFPPTPSNTSRRWTTW